jgi:hypothetical protein
MKRAGRARTDIIGRSDEEYDVTFNDKEIERERRKAISRRGNLDYNRKQEERDLLYAARTDTPEEFQARLAKRGIDLSSEKGRKVMAAYWVIAREPRR